MASLDRALQWQGSRFQIDALLIIQKNAIEAYTTELS